MIMNNKIDAFIKMTKMPELNSDYSEAALRRFHAEKQARINNSSRRTAFITTVSSAAVILFLSLIINPADAIYHYDIDSASKSPISINYFSPDYSVNDYSGNDSVLQEELSGEISDMILPADDNDAMLQILREYRIETGEMLEEIENNDAEHLLNNL